ncbi:hypothetical protein BSZ19_18505 [Bradyrhizobium japonicum]|uniref:Uncharacterized protein n=1 Tax=Bradyrhizobium japonicum TaxID=375 RepID=A0A1Y2JNX4_BRAJP|nr:hypothetical protein [Bradyrhizobium japonicum]OSJ32544.1 hypothetical protein BSZ19_18505 [Bradyrhizobium japonicum]
MTATHTIPERLAMSAAALLSFAVAMFVMARVVPVRHLLTRTEAQSAIGQLLSAALLTLGVTLIVDWRRKRRDIKIIMTCDGPIGVRGLAEDGSVYNMSDMSLVRPPLPSMVIQPTVQPRAEFQRHLTAALAVLLREPTLTIDASTLRMLAKHKERRPVKRDEKGRWRSVQ